MQLSWSLCLEYYSKLNHTLTYVFFEFVPSAYMPLSVLKPFVYHICLYASCSASRGLYTSLPTGNVKSAMLSEVMDGCNLVTHGLHTTPEIAWHLHLCMFCLMKSFPSVAQHEPVWTWTGNLNTYKSLFRAFLKLACLVFSHHKYVAIYQ